MKRPRTLGAMPFPDGDLTAEQAPADRARLAGPPSTLRREIEEQPEALARLLDGQRRAIAGVARSIRAFAPDWIQIAARGTSDNAARYAQYLFGICNGFAVALAAPSLITLYDSPPRAARALTIGISQSGQSPDVVAVLAEARRQGGATLAITGDQASPLAQVCQHLILLAAGREQSVAATKTYSNQLLALAMLSAALDRDPARDRQLAAVPASVHAALDSCEPLVEGAARFGACRRFLALGRGFNYATAHEIALKMQEMSYVIAEPYSPADFLHGPVAVVEGGFPVLVVAPSGQGSAGMSSLLDLLEGREARLLAVSDRAEVLARAEIALPMPANVPDWLSPIVAVVPGQIWARSLAIAQGHDPDRPRGLSKVTLTR
jgi:glucosamine--fructose-6-phosphate aminotransferase (isomerizing)